MPIGHVRTSSLAGNDSISAFFINLGEEEIKSSGSSGGEELCVMTLWPYNHLGQQY